MDKNKEEIKLKTRKMLKNKKGVSLIALTIMILVMIIIANSLVYYSTNSMRIANIKNMYSDIENLSSKVSSYYMEYGDIPLLVEYTNVEGLVDANILGANDGDKFWVLDLSNFQSLSLYYGQDYEELKLSVKENSSLSQSAINQYTDIYVINEKSNNIYYIEGIELDEIYYHTYTQTIDEVEVELVSIENIEI